MLVLMLPLLFALVSPSPAQTWNGEHYEWEMPVTWRIVGSDPSLPGDPEAILQQAWDLWSQEPCGGLSHVYQGWDPEGSLESSPNEVVFVLGEEERGELEGSTLAYTQCSSNDGCRVGLGRDVDWGMLECEESDLLLGVLLHELSHLVAAPNPCHVLEGDDTGYAGQSCEDQDARYSISWGSVSCSLLEPTAYDLALVAQAHGVIASIAEGGEDVFVEPGDETCFSAESADAVAWLEWDLGDGSLATGPDVCHAWPEDGTWTVTLRYGDHAGSCVGEDAVQVKVRSATAEPAGTETWASPGCGCRSTAAKTGRAVFLFCFLFALRLRRRLAPG